MITVWFEPHKTTLDNEAKLASGWNDVDLSPIGAGEQMQECVERFSKLSIQAIFSSDMQRSYKTAAAIAANKSIPIYIDSRLRECNYGDLTQHPKAEVDSLKASKISDPFPGGECYTDCVRRMQDFIEYLRANFDGQTVLIVGHRATQYGLESYILKKPLPQIVTAPWKWQPGWKYELR